ncbi:MAG: hypothetical protein MK297_11040 [Planctomycetes bacterium]|nr:hypothetical protein [Planctomycetota bacterium]
MSLSRPKAPRGALTSWLGEEVYAIKDSQLMEPFFVSVPSESDLWMFLSSRGGLTAGRVDADQALFPYMTEDRLHDGRHVTGPVTFLRISDGLHKGRVHRAFSFDEESPLRTHLYKGVTGNSLGFEEEVPDLGLTISYRWQACDELGWTRRVVVTNTGERELRFSVLDGLSDLQPYGVPVGLSQTSSCLVDAYKRAELMPESGLGIYALTARIVDRAEASEMLRANIAWCVGLEGPRLLSMGQLSAFREGRALEAELDLKGQRSGFFATDELTLAPGGSRTWWTVVDVGRSHSEVVERARALTQGVEAEDIMSALETASQTLRSMVASSDGVQQTGDAVGDLHHFSNTLYNCMRGGLFLKDHEIPTDDLRDFALTRCFELSESQRQFFDGLEERVSVGALHRAALATGDSALTRWCLEYLPLRFGRRHGDPSRPWNRFSIQTQDADGEPILQYEGNWRDIFQNWEALSLSFPEFVEGMIARFVNASTFDGFNPYRITRDGIDWEVPDPEDPWATIGYWGDHQVAYLVRLIEQSVRAHPGRLADLLNQALFSYADVPYRLAPYAALVEDPWNTISFDKERDRRSRARAAERGADGQLLHGPGDEVVHVTLAEKLLVPALSKLSNLVPGGGVWMNTQRPEWNDANNALVGLGLSVVTACHLHRYLLTVRELFASAEADLHLSEEVAEWASSLARCIEAAEGLGEEQDSIKRRAVVDELGGIFETYRERVWERGFGGVTTMRREDALALLDRATAWVAETIQQNRREDGLYHAYNLVDFSGDKSLEIGRLDLMLEGQVAVLSAGLLGPDEAASIGRALFESPLYREDQQSFTLYPKRELPGFLERNSVSSEAVAEVPLLCELIEAGEPCVLTVDADGVGRFHGDIANRQGLSAVLDRLETRPAWAESVARDREAVLGLFEETFNHRAFTGRSGTMYGYEGIGCIYWHMVSKLLLALQENFIAARRLNSSEADALAAHYTRVRGGLSAAKTPAEYGAFPAEPYSHTRGDGRARQPGMTGQVKEEVITRFGELGVRVEGGCVSFDLTDLRAEDLSSGALRFTFCGTPVEYVEGPHGISLTSADGEVTEVAGTTLDAESSAALLSRSGEWQRVRVGLG